MRPSLTIVIDTNVYISAMLYPNSVPARALEKAFLHGTILISQPILDKLQKTIFRKKFDPFISQESRETLLKNIEKTTLICTPHIEIQDCRDPKDNDILSLAVSEQANCILSGDKDLLVLHPYQNIPIFTPKEFLEFPT